MVQACTHGGAFHRLRPASRITEIYSRIEIRSNTLHLEYRENALKRVYMPAHGLEIRVRPDADEMQENTQEMTDDYIRMACAESVYMKIPQHSGDLPRMALSARNIALSEQHTDVSSIWQERQTSRPRWPDYSCEKAGRNRRQVNSGK
jgi:hypothetical protein